MTRANTNCKIELLETIGNRTIECAEIVYIASTLWGMNNETPPENKVINLKVGYSQDEYNQFLKQLNFDYDSGHGSQELYGNVWFINGEWMEREEYDGREWWRIMNRPKIPDNLI